MRDAAFAQSYMPVFRAVLHEHFNGIQAATFEEDTQHATDLVLRRSDETRFGCRVRRHEYYRDPYRYEFTIRSAVASGARTEFAKILAGDCDHLCYAFAAPGDDPADGFQAYTIVNLAAFRAWIDANHIYPRQLPNQDGSMFAVFDTRTMPTGIATRHDMGDPITLF